MTQTIKTETTTVCEMEIEVVFTRDITEDWDFITVEINLDGWQGVDENSFGKNMKAAEKWAAKAVARLTKEIEVASA